MIHCLQLSSCPAPNNSGSLSRRRRARSIRYASWSPAVRTQLERAFTDIFVEGEISNYRPAESGHLYFTLKDGSAQLRVVMWRTQARLLRFRPENGLQVIARGRVTVYDERGDLQFQAEYLEPKGAGALQIAFEQLKAKLAAEGLFDPSRKRPIPALASAHRSGDLPARRRPPGHPEHSAPPSRVGERAHLSGAGAGRAAPPKSVRVCATSIVTARSTSSLWRAAAVLSRTCSPSTMKAWRGHRGREIPVISAVGHETDFTICDFVADLRAPTPSAAAELVIRSSTNSPRSYSPSIGEWPRPSITNCCALTMRFPSGAECGIRAHARFHRPAPAASG